MTKLSFAIQLLQLVPIASFLVQRFLLSRLAFRFPEIVVAINQGAGVQGNPAGEAGLLRVGISRRNHLGPCGVSRRDNRCGPAGPAFDSARQSGARDQHDADRPGQGKGIVG